MAQNDQVEMQYAPSDEFIQSEVRHTDADRRLEDAICDGLDVCVALILAGRKKDQKDPIDPDAYMSYIDIMCGQSLSRPINHRWVDDGPKHSHMLSIRRIIQMLMEEHQSTKKQALFLERVFNLPAASVIRRDDRKYLCECIACDESLQGRCQVFSDSLFVTYVDLCDQIDSEQATALCESLCDANQGHLRQLLQEKIVKGDSGYSEADSVKVSFYKQCQALCQRMIVSITDGLMVQVPSLMMYVASPIVSLVLGHPKAAQRVAEHLPGERVPNESKPFSLRS